MSMDESSTCESESLASLLSVERRQRRPRASATLPEALSGHEAQEATSSATMTCRNEVRGSMRDGGSESLAQPSTAASAGGSKAAPWLIYCQLATSLSPMKATDNLSHTFRSFRPRYRASCTLV